VALHPHLAVQDFQDSKDFDNMPRWFEEHRYLGVKVPTEKHEFVLDRRAKDVERKIYSIIRQVTCVASASAAISRNGWAEQAHTAG
jgi:hypothetical protein